MTYPCPETLEERGKRMLETVVAVAQHGHRAPTTDQFRYEHNIPAPANVLDLLCAMGWLRSEIYGRNYRVLEVTKGPHRGLRTAKDPKGGAPWLVVDADGTKRLT